jgi:hypothetical protein
MDQEPHEDIALELAIVAVFATAVCWTLWMYW